MKNNKKIVFRARGIILFEGKLVVVKHSPDASFCALPGGHLEWQEDIQECLRREITEELGISPKIGRLLYINNFIDGKTIHSVEFFFEITNGNDYRNTENVTKTHAHEISQVCWLSPNDTATILPKTLWEDFKTGKIIPDKVRYIG